MKDRALARPGGKLLCSQRIKRELLYAAEGDLHGSIPALLQGDHEALIRPSECLLPSGHATEYLFVCVQIYSYVHVYIEMTQICNGRAAKGCAGVPDLCL